MRQITRRWGRRGRAVVGALAVVLVGVVGLMQFGMVPSGLTGTVTDQRTVTLTPATGGALEWRVFVGGAGLTASKFCGATATGTATDCTITAGRGAAMLIYPVPKAGNQFAAWTGVCGTGVPGLVNADGTRCSLTLMENWTAGAVMGSEQTAVNTLQAGGNGRSHVGVAGVAAGTANQQVFQTFTPAQTGVLKAASWTTRSVVMYYPATGQPFDVRIDVVKVDAAGNLTDQVIATAMERGLGYIHNEVRRVDFSSSPVLTAGQKYALKLACVECSGGRYAPIAVNTDIYPGGQFGIGTRPSPMNSDMLFAIHMVY